MGEDMSKGIRGKKAAALVEKALYGYPLFPHQKNAMRAARQTKAVIDVPVNMGKTLSFTEHYGVSTARLKGLLNQ